MWEIKDLLYRGSLSCGGELKISLYLEAPPFLGGVLRSPPLAPLASCSASPFVSGTINIYASRERRSPPRLLCAQPCRQRPSRRRRKWTASPGGRCGARLRSRSDRRAPRSSAARAPSWSSSRCPSSKVRLGGTTRRATPHLASGYR